MSVPVVAAKTCPCCRKLFEGKTQFCDRRCAASVSCAAQQMPLWEPEAIDWLHTQAGTDRPDMLTQRFNWNAARLGWTKRSVNAIKVKLNRLGLSAQATEDGWNCTGLALLLGISRDRVHDWCERGLIVQTCRKKRKSQKRITAKSFRRFIQQHPDWAIGIDPHRLLIVLGDSDSVRREIAVILRLALENPLRRGVAVKIAAEDGRVFDSLRAASRATFITRSHIKRSCETGKAVCGIQFRYIPAQSTYVHLLDEFEVSKQQKAIELRLAGYSCAEIAKQMGYAARTTVERWLSGHIAAYKVWTVENVQTLERLKLRSKEVDDWLKRSGCTRNDFAEISSTYHSAQRSAPDRHRRVIKNWRVIDIQEVCERIHADAT